MLSIEKCSKILNKNERKYSQQQVVEIRELLLQLAEIMYESKLSNHE